MANFYNPKYDTTELIKFTENTVERANYQQIQESLSNKMKEIYGNDIDLTNTTADGQWVMTRALLIDKMFEVIDNLNQSLNPATARGNFLDIVCSFNNVFRKGQTYSTVQCYVRPIRDDVSNGYVYKKDGETETYQEIKCVDNKGNIWVWSEAQNIDGSTFNTYFNSIPCSPTPATGEADPNVDYYEKSSENDYTPGYLVDEDGYQYTLKVVSEGDDVSSYFTFDDDSKKGVSRSKEVYTPLTFKCENIGPVDAKKGTFDKNDASINNEGNYTHGDVGKVIDLNRYPFFIWQVEDANVGNDFESDQSLRTRRELEISNTSITVLSGLEASLRQLSGIKDVKIINNPSGVGLNTDGINGGDNISIDPHSIYVVIRYENNIDEDNIKKAISEIIYNKLTPGISTYFNEQTSKTIIDGSIISFIIKNQFNINQEIKWKKCTPQAYPITLKILINKDFNSTHEEKIRKVIKDYTYNLSLNEKLTISGIINAINQSCVAINGVNPYIALNGSIDLGTGHTAEQYSENHLSYFDYNDATFSPITLYSGDNYELKTLTISINNS